MVRGIDTVRLSEAREMRQGWLDAEKAVMSGQEYRMGTKSLRRADLTEIASRIKFWENEIARLERGSKTSRRVQRIVPRDI